MQILTRIGTTLIQMKDATPRYLAAMEDLYRFLTVKHAEHG